MNPRNSQCKTGPRPRIAGVLSVGFALLSMSVHWGLGEASAGLAGNPELLKMAAARYRANLDRLATWQGRVMMTLRTKAKHIEEGCEVVVQCAIEFVCDARKKAWRSCITKIKDVKVQDGREVPRLSLGYRGVMFHDNAYFQVVHRLSYKGRRTVFIQSEPFSRPGWSYDTFEPLFFLTRGGPGMDKDWLLVYDHASDAGLVGSVKRSGRFVTLHRTFPDGMKYTGRISLDQGGNLSEQRYAYDTRTGSHQLTLKWTWVKINGVWVPKEASKVHYVTDKSGLRDEYRTTVQWTEQSVNQPLPQDAFSLAKLGLRQGDWVYDTRTRTEYRIEDPNFPKPPAKRSAAVPRATAPIGMANE